MFRLFDKRKQLKSALQLYNALTLCLASYDLITNPQAKFSEVGADVLIHAVTMYSLRDGVGVLAPLFTSAANIFRMGSIYSGLTLGGSSVPQFLNCLDMANHFINAVAVLPYSDEELNEDEAQLKIN